VLQIRRREIHAKALGFFVDLDRLRDDLKTAQQSELDALEPKRVELQAVDDFIKQSENETEEIATALRKAHGKVREALQAQQDRANERNAEYIAPRDKLLAELSDRTYTDEAIESTNAARRVT
jgi:hypothetical protein